MQTNSSQIKTDSADKEKNNMTNQLVINWHILEACNFHCKYCFAHWPQDKCSKEIWRSPEFSRKLLEELKNLPSHVPGNWGRIRLNIAGGEPMLLQRKGDLERVFHLAINMGFDLSMISNGYKMDDEFIKKWAPNLQILGISVDSARSDTNDKIGRKTESGKQISAERVGEIFRMARRHNPDIECKLNTVVSSANQREDMRSFVKSVSPDRWKIFKMLPIANTMEIADKQVLFKITDKQFQHFLDKHEELADIMSPEDNDAMTESYLMVDPLGRLYQNTPANGNYKHVVSKPIHIVGAAEAFKQIKFSGEKFALRYKTN